MMGIVCTDNRVTIRFAVRLSLPLEGCYKIFGARGGAEIDFAAPLCPKAVEGWPAWARQYKSGFGLGRMGMHALGYGHLGTGFGNGPFGQGPLGRGTFCLEAQTSGLADGDWQIVIVGCDGAGNFLADPGQLQVAELAIAGTPAPPTAPAAKAYNPETDALSLEWELSEDDEAA
jgi:hypothetical protein